ncbi:MAG: 2-oxoacid:acceptor oxidoreductase subunit alpha [bacterium]
MKNLKQTDLSILIAGAAGQGINTIAEVISEVALSVNFYFFSWIELMSRIRGGNNSIQMRIGNHPNINAPVKKIDIFIPLNQNALRYAQKKLDRETLIISEEPLENFKIVKVPFLKMAKDLGNPVFANTIVAGIITGMLEISPVIFSEYIKRHFGTKGSDIVAKNIRASETGYKIAEDILSRGLLKPSIKPVSKINGTIMEGSEIIGLGAVAGGCNFIAAYPMTPSSGVWTYLAQHGEKFGIITEQSEDEISAMNMGLGASYAGARAMVSTSGGGFDLMAEGLSLAGVQETPIVIHLAQRPGPATGLPTRTEQADLELALYAGHGEFPRIILAPGTPEQGFYLTQRAFNLAEIYQMPVFVLTDQFFIDSLYTVKHFDVKEVKIENRIVKTTKEYKRYMLTHNGISPRGIPGYGTGFVCADCHHHDEDGHISEDLNLRTGMVNKLMKKANVIKNEIIPPELYGSKNYKTLVICWGSNYNIVKEVINKIERRDIAMLHYSQIFPLHPKTDEYLNRALHLIIVENNATAQFAKLIKLNTGIEIENKVLKYNGLPFFVEEIKERVEALLT